MQRLHSHGGKKKTQTNLFGSVSAPESYMGSEVSYFRILSCSGEEHCSILSGKLYCRLFFPCTVQPWHTQTGYYSIFTVWLQCPLLPLGRYCRLESFLQVLFYQYPLEYNFNFSPPCGTLVWVWAHSPKCALIITEICSWYFFFFCLDLLYKISDAV